MKTKIISLAIATLFCSSVLYAQGPQHHGCHNRTMTKEQIVEQRISLMDKTLSLTDEQKSQLTTILNEDTSTSSSEERAMQMRESRRAQDEKIKAILTDEQKAKYADMQKVGKNKHKRLGDMNRKNHGHQLAPDPHGQIQTLKDKLNLSEEQITEIKNLMDKADEEQLQKQKELNNSIKNVLTKEQQATFEEMIKNK
ncbi:MAG: hypothetical protein HUJ96_09595 [Marinilabiliaceae bacterium]|nr:hypothetical protein [Marinilabiliaceae bacterium]